MPRQDAVGAGQPQKGLDDLRDRPPRRLGAEVVDGAGREGQRGMGPEPDRLLVGAMSVALLAIATEVAFSALERRLVPWDRR